MTTLLGNARFTYDSTAGTQTVNLRAPLRAKRGSVRQTLWVHEDMHFDTRAVTVTGDGVHELVADIRYEDAPARIENLLLFGMRGGVITYIPDNGTPANFYDCYLIEPGGGGVTANATATATMGMDPDSGFPGNEWNAITIRLRKTDGTSFDSYTST